MQIAATDPTAGASLSPAQLAKLQKSAQDFEAMALGQMLAPMFNTVDSAHSAFGGGEAESTLKPLLIDAIAKHIAAHGGLGLAAPVFASLLQTQEAANAAGHGGPAGGLAGRPAATQAGRPAGGSTGKPAGKPAGGPATGPAAAPAGRR